MATLMDGVALRDKLKKDIAIRTGELFEKTGKKPVLAVVLVGENPASEIYVNSKKKTCAEVGIESRSFVYKSLSENELEDLIDKLNADPAINGILVQLPLPSGMDEDKIINRISPLKDVDGFHPFNTGKLWIDLKPYFFPCTPWGMYELLKEYEITLAGKEVVVVGRSNIVGKPIAGILMQKLPFGDATVTVTHSRTRDLESHLKRADVIVAAIGRPEFIRGEMVKEGVVVLDVGINRVEDSQAAKGYKVVGDVHFESVAKKASFITPVPGGVGPMTIAVLMQNTLRGFELQNGLLSL